MANQKEKEKKKSIVYIKISVSITETGFRAEGVFYIIQPNDC